MNLEVAVYALFDNDRQIESPFPSEKEISDAVPIEDLVKDVPVADEKGVSCLQPVSRSPRCRRRHDETVLAHRRNQIPDP